MRDFGRLLRLSLAPTAAADIAAGTVLAHGGRWPAGGGAWLLMASSLAIYHGNMALNDWVDREGDRRTRPSRPLPSGRIDARIALACACVLIAGGIALAWSIASELGAWMGGVALTAVLYNTAGRGAWTGPLLLGACRAGNIAAASLLPTAGSLDAGALPIIAGAYGVYVFSVSRLARLEDESPDLDPAYPRSAYLWIGAAILALVPFVPWPPPFWPWRGAAAVVGIAGALGVAVSAYRLNSDDRTEIQAAVGGALRRLLFFTAAVALLPFRDGSFVPLVVAAAVLAGFPVAYLLRRAFPPT